jgi:hypothetical protein
VSFEGKQVSSKEEGGWGRSGSVTTVSQDHIMDAFLLPAQACLRIEPLRSQTSQAGQRFWMYTKGPPKPTGRPTPGNSVACHRPLQSARQTVPSSIYSATLTPTCPYCAPEGGQGSAWELQQASTVLPAYCPKGQPVGAA